MYKDDNNHSNTKLIYLEFLSDSLTIQFLYTHSLLMTLSTRVQNNKETVARSPKGQVLLVLLLGFAECGNRKALRLKAQGVYSCK